MVRDSYDARDRKVFRDGMRSLDDASQKAYKASFMKATPAQRLTAVANVPLTIAALGILIALLGRNQAAAAQILGSPAVSIIMLLFVSSIIIHMRIGMAAIIEDYVHDESAKLTLLMANTFFTIAVGLAAVYGLLKLSFGL